MAETQAKRGYGDDPDLVVIRHSRFRRMLGWVALVVGILLILALVIAWTQRREIAGDIIERELEKRGVEGSFTLDRVGIRTQQISNLRIGDPDNPDLTADRVRIQMRLKWSGGVDVYRIVARGVRLRGRVAGDGSVSWGELDKLLPPPGDDPFRLPDVAVDIADSSVSLATPWGPLGFAIRGSGNLTGGFEGRFVSASPRLETGNCFATNLRGAGAIEVEARRPKVVGPLTADRFACPPSDFTVAEPRLEIESRFGEGFDSFDASARILSQRLMAGPNGLAALNGTVSFEGNPSHVRGSLDLTARQARLATIFADRTRLAGDYRMNVARGILAMQGRFTADDARIESGVAASVAALDGLSGTPIGPIAQRIAASVRRSAGSFDVRGDISLVNAPGGGRVRIADAVVDTVTGARVTIADGNGVTYSWPTGGLTFDGRFRVAGGGLPSGTVLLRQGPGGQVRGRAEFAPMSAGGARLALSPIDFQMSQSGETRFATVARMSGPLSGGMVRDLRLPISGRIGANGGLWIGQSCIMVSIDALRMQEIRLGRTRLPICPTGPAIVYQAPGGELQLGARIAGPRLSGRIGGAPLAVRADQLVISGRKDFSLADVVARIGDPDSPVVVTAERLTGSFAGAGISGTVSGGTAVIANVPLMMSEIDGEWLLHRGELTIDGSVLVSDRADPARFYPLRSDDTHFVLADNKITATGTLRHPGSGARIIGARIEHDLDTGSGVANLDVPGVTFGPGLQPEELTRLTEGVVALVEGTVHGRGQIHWTAGGETSSTGDFWTRDLDFAAPFGPVEGLSTTIHFTDLLGLVSAPGQVARVERINPGIIVEDGVITYQLLPDQLVKVERGVWPFMGGQLILHETILNFGSDAPKRLTFELVGFDAKMFVDSLGFEGLEITGTFDGVLPMIFDDAGGRIVGGRLESRPPGGRFRYTGTEPDAGLMVGVAFDLLSDMHFRNMVIRLDGDLAGEFATRFTIEQISLGQEGGFVASIVRGAFSKVPLRVNLNITGPFRALIQMAKGFKDPTPVIEPVMPFPLDTPGIATETRILRKEEDQERLTPAEDIEVSTQPPQPSE